MKYSLFFCARLGRACKKSIKGTGENRNMEFAEQEVVV